MDSWATETINSIENQLKSTREKEIRFYRIDEFKRNISRVDTFSKSCPHCRNEKSSISEISNKIDEAIQVPGKPRREYDRLISRLSKHMQKEHGFYAPYYFSYLFSFFGMIIGLLIGYILTKFYPAIWVEILSIGFAIGLIPAYVWGSVKDNKIRSEKRLM